MTTIPAILRENAAKWPDRNALISTHQGHDSTLTFAQLETAAENFAAFLVGRGVRNGDAVLVFVPMSIALYVALLGLFRMGATAVFLDPTSGISHINSCCKRLPPAALISIWPLRWLRPFISGLRQIPRSLPPPKPDSTQVALSLPGYPSPETPALITFTSGSTGAPKAAVRTHQFLIAQHEALKNSIALEPGETDLTTLPVFVLANLASGVTSVLPDAKISHPGSVDAQRIDVQVRRLRPSRTGGSPAFYHRLATVPSSLRSLKKIYTGGAPVFPSFLQKLQSLVPDSQVVAVYGSTEAEPIAHIACDEITPQDWQDMREGKGLLAGTPIPEIRLRILPDQWNKQVLIQTSVPQGVTGEILVTGQHVLKGYLNGLGDEETKVLIDGEIWHRTGDAGYLDTRGRLWLMGRCSARIEDTQGVLYPFAVECVAMSFPFIKRTAFVQIEESRLLAVEGEEWLSEENLHKLKSAVAWANISNIRLLKRIPVDARHNAKVNYPQLMKLLRSTKP